MKNLLIVGTLGYILGVHAAPLAKVAVQQVRNLHDLVQELPVGEMAQVAGQGCNLVFQVAHQVPMHDLVHQAGTELTKASDGLGKIPIAGTYLRTEAPQPLVSGLGTGLIPAAPQARILSADGLSLQSLTAEP